MCDPITIAGIALTGASAVANNVAQGKVERARNDALAAERIRQGGLDQEADAINAQSQQRFEGFEDKQDAKSTQLGDFFQSQGDTPDGANAAAAIPISTSNVTVQEEAKQRGKASAFTDAQGKNLGQLRAFGDVLGGISREQARDASAIGQIGGFKRGSSSVLPYELEAANSKGAKMKFLGDVLGGAGSLATSAGLGGATLGSTAATAPVTSAAWSGLRNVTSKVPTPTARPVGLGRLY